MKTVNTQPNWKHRIKVHLEKQQHKRKQKKKKDVFNQIDKNLRNAQFKNRKELSMKKHFYMPKLMNEETLELMFINKVSPTSADLRNAFIIYPVLCGWSDFEKMDKWFHESRENIAKMAGISPNSVDNGTRVLEQLSLSDYDGLPMRLLQREKRQVHGARMWFYNPGFFRYGVAGNDPRDWEGHCFGFFTSIIDNGIWATLSRKAKLLYLAMRSNACFDQQAYQEIEGVYIPDYKTMEAEDWMELDDLNKKEYHQRKWDVCDRSLKKLFELAKMTYTDTRQLTDGLEDFGLIEKPVKSRSVFMVYRKPRTLIKA